MRTHATAIAALLTIVGSSSGQTSWDNAAGGLWSVASNWSPADVPNSLTESAVLGNLGGNYAVTCDISTTILGLTVQSDALLEINGGQLLGVDAGGVLNNGHIFINRTGSGSNTIVQSTMPMSILGTGLIELNSQALDLNDASLQAQAGAELTIGAGQTVSGSGTMAGPVVLLGVVDADRDGRDLRVIGTVDMTGGGTLQGTNNGSILLQGQIEGGTLNGGIDVSLGTATISGSTATGSNGLRAGATLDLMSGGMTNNGAWLINTVSSGSNTTMRAGEAATIDGTGTIELNAAAADHNDAALAGQVGIPLTLGSGQTVHGSGRVMGPIVLMGTIDADRDGRELRVDGEVDASFGGVLQGTNNGIVRFEAQLTGGTFAGGVESVGGLSSVDGTTASGMNAMRGGSTTTILAGGLTNDGSIFVNTTGSGSNTSLVAGTSTILDGNGTIELNSVAADPSDAGVYSNGGAVLTIGAMQTVTGSGRMDGEFVLDGTADADRSGRDLQLTGSFDMTGGGTLIGTNGGTIALNAAITGGSFEGGVESFSGNSSVDGTIANEANGLRAGATLSVLSGGLTNNGTITVNTVGGGSNAVLMVAESATIDGSGTIDLNAVASDLFDAHLNVATDQTLTIGSLQSITGSGRVSGTIVSNGTINANRAGRDLLVDADVDMSGGGIMQGTNDGALSLSGSATGGQWLGGVEVSGGLTAVRGVTMSGDNGLRSGGTAILDATGITVNGTLLVNITAGGSNSLVTTAESCTIDGTGIVELNAEATSFADAGISSTDGAVLTLGESLTLAGRGQLTGAIDILGTIDPGDAGDETDPMNISGTISLADSTTTRMGIGGTGSGDRDRFSGTGTLELDGTLELELVDGFTPVFNSRYEIANVGSIVGDFDTVITPTVGLGIFRLAITGTTVEAVWTCDADVNADGILDFFDVQFFLNAFVSEALYGDYNEDGMNDFFDVLAFLNDFAAGCL